jgi:radical SAM-linked protein
LSVKYSEGFHPLPKFVFSQPLPVGVESVDEWLVAELEGERLRPDDVAGLLNKELPEGLRILSGVYLPLKVNHSSGIIKEVEYLVFLKGGSEGEYAPVSGLNIRPENIDGILREFLSKDFAVVSVVREGKPPAEVDIRPLVAGLSHTGEGALKLVLKKSQSVSVRPGDVLACIFGISLKEASLIPVLKIKTIQ